VQVLQSISIFKTAGLLPFRVRIVVLQNFTEETAQAVAAMFSIS
jgi:hypothetical protein